jgi:gamma-glutamylaminecyclotransferase
MLLFVYGTLRQGERNHAELSGARFVREASTHPRYQLVDMGGFPALLEGGTTAVRGELYEVEEHFLPRLDRFEDVPTLYERKPVSIPGASALGYVMRREVARTAPLIPSGDWCATKIWQA